MFGDHTFGHVLAFLFVALIVCPDLSAQSSVASEATPPKGFSGIELGITLDDAKERLRADSNFLFRGDPDVTMLAEPNETLIETTGATFVDRAYFQFSDLRLYTIILELDQTRLDHYTMYTTFVERYGEPSRLDPREAIWEFEGVRLSLERPLRIKYIDTSTLDKLIEEQRRGESFTRISRDRFLDQF